MSNIFRSSSVMIRSSMATLKLVSAGRIVASTCVIVASTCDQQTPQSSMSSAAQYIS